MKKLPERHTVARLALLAMLAVGASGCATIPAGYRGVKVHYYGAEGKELTELGIGRYAYFPISTGVYKFPIFQQNVVWGSDEAGGITFQTREGLTVGANLGMTYTIDAKRVSVLFRTYRRGIEEITDTFLRNIVIDACNRVAARMEVEEIYGSKKAEFLDQVSALVNQQVTKAGIDVHKVYAIGQFRLPATVVDAIDTKIAATQRAQQRENELREAEAESANRIAQAKGAAEAERISVEVKARASAEAQKIAADADRYAAEARAQANAKLTEGLTAPFLQYETIRRWNGQLPEQVMGADIPFLIPSVPRTAKPRQ
jgi:regulator of protease activity HflC (stomatin/prohibitin superfamily)